MQNEWKRRAKPTLHSISRYIVGGWLIAMSLLACEPDEERITHDSTVTLRFSTDTVLFDTVLTSRQSITKRLRVYNDEDRAVNISTLQLEQGAQSPYTLYVNGRPGKSFNDIRLFGKDSLLILVDVLLDPRDENLPFIVEDKLTFSVNGSDQYVQLAAWGQDAIFLNGETLPCNSQWTADRPYVIYNSILIDTLCQLTIDAGARVYSHNGSYIFVKGSIRAQGTADDRITFRNDRLDERYADAPGQWGGLVFLPGSKDNLIEFADIRNAEVGIYLGTPDDNDEYDLVIGHCRIENMGGNEVVRANDVLIPPGYGVLAITSDLYMHNTLINNCTINTLGNFAGGNYQYEHCTFANFSFDFFRSDPAVVIADNLQLADNSLLVEDLNASMINSIIWGSLTDELLISNSGESQFNLSISHSLLRTGNNPYLDNTVILNQNPDFIEPRAYDYSLDLQSPAIDVGLNLGASTDLVGSIRDDMPDLGALENTEQ